MRAEAAHCVKSVLIQSYFGPHFSKIIFSFIEITFWHGCSPVNLLHIFRTPFSKDTSEWLLLYQSIYSTSPKCYWTLLKRMLNDQIIPLIPPLLHNNKCVMDFNEKSEIFNSKFSNQCWLILCCTLPSEGVAKRCSVK